MASAMVARIATAMMISSSVKPRWRLTGAINIKFDLLRLLGAATRPFHGQRHPVYTGKRGAVIFLEFSRRRFLNHLHDSIAGVDVEFFRLVRRSRRGLNFRHAISQNLTHPILLCVERVRLKAILNRASERKHAESKNRQAQQHLVQREGTTKISNLKLTSS